MSFNRNFGQGEGRNSAEAVTPDKGWKDLVRGGIIPTAGNAESYKTGDWRSRRPIWNEDKCIHCLMCWRFCPDVAIITDDGKFKEFDYDHCKGCGVCVSVCPTNAIDFVDEDMASDEDKQKNEQV
ncbi:MAG: pyruvate ferredoxin oxidoreductase delta subunit [Thermosediminibacterales bacterium]|nr:pyruvate ferredoxin oxidoreductase delta subunit [Thermosediminibacterales bacterium]MDK2836045.1 pyruvate ferredoxin oxidoreductase delta subunit [Thermosediminibacterales bacterium]